VRKWDSKRGAKEMDRDGKEREGGVPLEAGNKRTPEVWGGRPGTGSGRLSEAGVWDVGGSKGL
jgi:hypothetical protein